MKHSLVALIIPTLLAPSSFAQSNDVKLDEIIVTARKKKENLQEVPISATSFDEKKLEGAGIESVRDLADLTPNVSIIGSSSGRYITPYIRGQGNQDANLPEEISVSFYLDEVPLPRYAFDNELIDVEKIEVLRGPQGTLFGKNTQAGAINITTKDPNASDGHKLTATYGNLDTRSVGGTTNFKLGSDKLQNRLSLKYKERGGYIYDTLQKRDLGDMNVFAGSNALQYRPSESLKLTFKIGLQDEEGTDPLIVARDIQGYPKTGQDILPAYDNHLYTTSLKAEKDFGDVVLTTIAAFNYHDFHVKYDEADYYIANDYITSRIGATLAAQYINNPDILYRDIKEFERQYFGEVRLNNKETDLAWTAGLNFSKNNYRLVNFVNTFTTGPKRIHQNVQLLTTALSGFGEVTKQLPSKLALTVGARLIHDQKEFKSYHSSTDLAQYQQDSEKDFTDYAAKVALGHKTTENINTYFSFARGYQSGGFPSYQFNNYNAVAEDQGAYGESSSLAYELGIKSQLAGSRLRLNAAIFYNDIKDKQVRARDPNTNLSYYANIDTDVYGGEIESEYKLSRDLTLGANIGHTNSKFAEATPSTKKGARLANIPYWSGSTFGQFSRYYASFDGLFIFRATYKYNGSRYGDNTNVTKMGSYGLWNFRTGIDKENYSFFVYVDNAFDKSYESQAYFYTSLDTDVSSLGMPRLYGVTATVRF